MEKKQKKIDNEKLYEAYGGEEKYYRDKLIEAGMMKIIITN